MTQLEYDEVMSRCAALAGSAAAAADEAERLRRLPPSLIDEVTEADLWRLVMPTGLGGHGLGITELAHGTRRLAQGCPASAWTISFLVMHSWLLTKFGEAARAEFFAEQPWALAPAPLAPTGTLTAVDGGYRVSGRWEWATGVHHGEWVMVHAVQTEPEFATRFVVVRVDEVTIEDVWHTSGMRGTGSDAVHLDDVFVPEHRTLPSAGLMFGSGEIEGDAMAGLPVPQVLALMAAAPALGAAEAAVDLFRERIAGRVLAYSLGDRAKDQPVSQARLGAVMTQLAATRANWDRAIARLAAVPTAGPLTLEERVDLRLAAAYTVRSVRELIGSIGEGSGASVYFADSPFQRLQRDVEVLKGHVIFDWDRATQIAGRAALGIEPGPADMV
ncbi:MAG: acyl-CoA dehydrogenase family protein [Acidimicrobiales bacterium]